MPEEIKVPKIGDHVVFVDASGHDQNALVGCVFGNGAGGVMPCINLCFVCPDKDREDSYGRQIDRSKTSVVHKSAQVAGGFYWRWPEEEKLPWVMPNRS